MQASGSPDHAHHNLGLSLLLSKFSGTSVSVDMGDSRTWTVLGFEGCGLDETRLPTMHSVMLYGIPISMRLSVLRGICYHHDYFTFDKVTRFAGTSSSVFAAGRLHLSLDGHGPARSCASTAARNRAISFCLSHAMIYLVLYI